MNKLLLDWNADIIPGKCVAGIDINKLDYNDIIGILDSLDRDIYRVDVNESYIDITDNKNYRSDLVMSIFFNKNWSIEIIRIYKSNQEKNYKGKIFGKYGLGDRIADLREFGYIEREPSGEEFLLINENHLCGLGVANGLDISLDEDPDQNIAIINIYKFFKY